MILTRVGTLPVSALNVGLVASVGGLQAEIGKLQRDISLLSSSIVGALELSATLFDPSSFAAAYAASLLPATTELIAGQLPFIAGDFAIDAALDLAFVELQLNLIGTLQAELQAGVDAGGLAGWSYGGRSAGFGNRLQQQTQGGFGNIGPNEQINALVLATESLSAWGNFSLSFNTGPLIEADPGPTTTREVLTFLGELNGGQWNSGVVKYKVPIDLFKLELDGLRASLLASLDIAAGVQLPDLSLLVGGDLAVDLAFDALIDVGANVDLSAQIGDLNLKIQALLDAIAEINLQLSGGGLTLWLYSGAAKDFGAALATELEPGLPGGNGPDTPAYGLAIATKSPSAWASFGLIFKTS